MRQGLIAQWHRGIVARGLVGAMLLMIPVLVGATIGLGGVAGGLTSLATGPSETAVGPTSAKTAGDSPAQNLERLSASLTTTLAQRLSLNSRTGGAGGKSGGATLLQGTSVSGGTQTDSSGSVSSQSSGGGSPAATGSGSGTTTPPATSPGVTSTAQQTTDLVTQILNGLLNPQH